MNLCTIFCVFVLVSFLSQMNALDKWHKYVWKTVYDCMKMNRNIQDLVTLSRIFTKCYQGTWEERIRSKILVKESQKSNHSFFTPYNHIQHLYKGQQSTTIHIKVYRLFKLNLTLIRLDIKRSLTGCVHGNFVVSRIKIPLHF